MSFWKHLKTVHRHRRLVRKGCFQVGLYWQGLTHDLSKYSPTEFLVGVRYCTGTRSPNAIEREKKGYSTAWLHHKGRNRHHFEYWTDMDATGQYRALPMPRRYFAEMVMDRIAACKTYHGSRYQDSDPLTYFLNARETPSLHPETAHDLRLVLTLLAKQGEPAAFRYIREVVLPGLPITEDP